MENQTGGFSFPDFKWWVGVVEGRDDPKKLGRVQVRIYSYHTGDKGKMPTEDLPWAMVNQSITSAANSGVGQSPTGLLEGTTVFGFFLDGGSAQTPMVIGSMAGIPSGEGFEGGYKDPSGKYPREAGESDVNKLARGERTSDTIVQKKRSGVDTASGAFGSTFTEPETKYAAKYPYNHVKETESGHIEEFDDTPGAERYALWHKSGTFEEISPDGSKVTKIVKDNYEIIAGDGYIHVKGNVQIVVDGNASVKGGGNASIEVDGNVREQIHGDYGLTVDGNFDVQVGGHHFDNSDGQRKVTAPRIDLNP